jgi:hypothetical protein
MPQRMLIYQIAMLVDATSEHIADGRIMFDNVLPMKNIAVEIGF